MPVIYRDVIPDLAKVVAQATSGIFGAIPDSNDYALAKKLAQCIKDELQSE